MLPFCIGLWSLGNWPYHSFMETIQESWHAVISKSLHAMLCSMALLVLGGMERSPVLARDHLLQPLTGSEVGVRNDDHGYSSMFDVNVFDLMRSNSASLNLLMGVLTLPR